MFSCCKKNKINDRNVIELKGIKIEEKKIININLYIEKYIENNYQEKFPENGWIFPCLHNRCEIPTSKSIIINNSENIFEIYICKKCQNLLKKNHNYKDELYKKCIKILYNY